MNTVKESNENLLLKFPPFLRKNMEELILNGDTGLVRLTLNDILPMHNNKFEDGQIYSYRYFLKIPYAGKRLSWELIFNPEDIYFAPDFDFNDHSFLNGPEIDFIMENVPSLDSWNIKNENSLRSVLEDFLKVYKNFHLNKLQSENIFTYIYSQYEHLITSVNPKDVEVLVEATTVHVFVKIDVDISKIPEGIKQIFWDKNLNKETLGNNGGESCILIVNFHKSDGSRVTTSLQLSPQMEEILGKRIQIPTYTKQSILGEYVNMISGIIHEQLIEIQQGRKKFLTCLCLEWQYALIECDQVNCTISFLSEVDNYLCLVCIEVGPKFPHEKPIVTLTSLSCMIPKKFPCTKVLDDCPHSVQWSSKFMIKKIKEHISNAIVKFKNHKH